jgi:uncharacterized protein YdeI (YjbR/CyaY-like superfamily)
MNPKVDAFIGRAKKWQDELAKLRAIAFGCGLNEELKWGKPCYQLEGKNLFIINGLKESCAFMFFTGALLKDDRGVLAAPGPNSQSGRWIKFTSVQEIVKMEPVLKAYIHEAIEAEKAGLKVVRKNPAEFPLPKEFQRKLKKMPALKKAFESLTPGRQRAYNIFFSAPKQSQTREARIDRCIPRILERKGMNDR